MPFTGSQNVAFVKATKGNLQKCQFPGPTQNQEAMQGDPGIYDL